MMDRQKKPAKKSYKVVLAGDGRVGKTSLRTRYMGRGFAFMIAPTLGVDFTIKKLENAVVQIWDLAGQILFASIRKQFYNEAHGAIIVFDLSNKDSFDNLSYWLHEIEGNANCQIPLVIVGNKADLKEKARKPVDQHYLDDFLQELREKTGLKVPYLETSALTGLNVDKLFSTMFDELGF